MTVPIGKEVIRIDENGEKVMKNILHIQFTDTASFVVSSLSSLVNNFFEKFIKLSVNMDLMIKNLKLVELYTKYETVFLNTQTLKMI